MIKNENNTHLIRFLQFKFQQQSNANRKNTEENCNINSFKYNEHN